MKKKFTLSRFLKRPLLFMLVLALVVFGCYKIRRIIQPTTGEVNSSFEVRITLDTISGQDYSTAGDTGLFGALIPVGWTVKDSFDFKKVSHDSVHTVKGIIVHDSAQSAMLEAKTAAPGGYYWWGGRTIPPLVDMNGLDSIYLVPEIFTDNHSGDFNLRYAFGDLENAAHLRAPYKEISDNYPISIKPSGIKAVWSSGNIGVYPNPSQGDFYISLPESGITGSKKLSVYTISGAQVYSCLLVNQVNHITLKQFAKGTYILALENQGRFVTKKIVLQ